MGKVIVVFILDKFLLALLRLESKLIVAVYISILFPPSSPFPLLLILSRCSVAVYPVILILASKEPKEAGPK
jgi:hypothetical protein